MRKSWDEYFMEIAEIVKTRSTCLRRQVGAVIVKDNRIITTGYNGAPSGLRHCTDIGGCERERLHIPSGQRHELCRALHAEQNAIIQAAKVGSAAFCSVPTHSLRFFTQTGQAVLTAPAWHFSVQVQTIGVSAFSPSSVSAMRSASSTWFRKCTVSSPSSSRSIMR